MTDEQKRLLNTCGKGWFILMMADRHDVYTFVDLTTDSAYKTRLRAYESLQGSRKEILRDMVKEDAWDTRIRFEKLDKPNQWYRTLALDVLSKVYNL